MGSQNFWSGFKVWKSFQCASTIGLLAVGVVATSVVLPSQAQLPPSPDTWSTTTTSYRVIVDSSSPQTLAQVRQVEPTAFLRNFSDGKIRIQAGAFDTAVRTQEQVDALARLGIPSTAYDRDGKPVYSQMPNGPSTQPSGPPLPRPGDAQQPVSGMPKGYYAIVPVDRDLVGITYEKFRKMGIAESFITIGQETRGWHVSVGVYPNRAAADAMSQYLRDKGGMDARTYYER